MSNKIYFDMDGVLADFDASARKYSGAALLNRRGNMLTGDLLTEKRERWRKIEQDHSFWADIHIVQGIDSILNIAKKIGELFVLTSLPSTKNFIGGSEYVDFIEHEKRAWIKKYLSNYFDTKHILVARIAKEKLIHPTTHDLLIDDRPENIADWAAFGGHGIVYKSPAQTIKELTNM